MREEGDTIGPSTKSVRRFAVQAAIALSIFTAVVFAVLFVRTIYLTRAQAREQASSYIDLIVTSRAWNAMYGGVWVEKTPGVESNPFLRKLGIQPDTSTVSGQFLTLRNPAAMTVEMSKIAALGQGVQFELTSLKVVNPANAPDAWERTMLGRFETDRSEVAIVENRPGGRVLRMMRPLITDQSCLKCHANQGYKVGDVRGAISLTLPLGANDRSLLSAGLTLGAVFLAVVSVAGAVGYGLVARMSSRVEESERQLFRLAHTDALTGLANRRAILDRLAEELARAQRSGHRVGLIEVDADRFKLVNDEFGHAAGDTVLQAIANRIVGEMREYDTAGRLGGEEFLIISPETDHDGVASLAERLRVAVQASPVVHAEHAINITISAGATLSVGGDTAEDVLLCADKALYAAKDGGRNRVEIG